MYEGVHFFNQSIELGLEEGEWLNMGRVRRPVKTKTSQKGEPWQERRETQSCFGDPIMHVSRNLHTIVCNLSLIHIYTAFWEQRKATINSG